MADLDANSPSGENPNEMAPNGVGTDGSPQVSPTPNWREFIDGLDKLNSSLGTKLDNIKETVTEGTRLPPPEPPDFDQMSNGQLVAHVTNSVRDMVQSAIQAALKPVTDQITGVQTDLVTTKGELSLKELRAKHKDFAEWKDDMIAAVGKHPTFSLEEVYDFVKARNPEKARTLEAKYNPPAPKPRPFGGLTPSSNGRAGEPILTGMDATRSAYNEVMARHPGILPILQDL